MTISEALCNLQSVIKLVGFTQSMSQRLRYSLLRILTFFTGA